MSHMQTPMRHHDKEMVPKILVQAMFALMIVSVALVAFAQWARLPDVGQITDTSVAAKLDFVMTGDTRSGQYQVLDTSGRVLGSTSDDKAGFIGVIGRVVDRERMQRGVVGNPPLHLIRHDNGTYAITDDATGMVVELVAYGADNQAAFGRLLR
ncbi:MAG: photosynthetic complex assembly protein [Limimaricola sp.]|uniref:photosynthetic complex assembly protein PuhC n=1 Tax=Limimaricola sp. TaxID=2211665 RepID=UPI001D9FA831|nr:photosynthetic complex assembly protein PuhC [Limimaricola sp.]MBI1417139.1 photosynthetic complex assembly protein [Limimaricola sp.]